MECVDGEYQTFKSKDGAYVREHFFNTPELKEMVADWSDDDIWRLNRGGHDPHKVYAAYEAAVRAHGPADGDPRQDRQGLRHGRVGRGAEHHPPAEEDGHESITAASATASSMPIADEELDELPYVTFAEDSPELKYMRERRRRSAATCRSAAAKAAPLAVPALSAFERCSRAREEREISTTMAFVRILQHAAARQEDRQAHRADRARRVAHLRHGGHVPPARHLEPGRASSTRRRTPTS